MCRWAIRRKAEDRAWYTATLFNSQGGKENGEAYQPSDFLPDEEKTAPPTEKELERNTQLTKQQWISYSIARERGSNG